MTVSVHDTETTHGFEQRFDVLRLAPLASIDNHIERLRPAIACFDFDFPTKPGLNLLRQTKRTHPSLPLIMLTVQHSEALAVWAFRARVWDYLVKPLTKIEFERCMSSLAEMMSLRDPRATPRTAAVRGSVMPEENRTNGARAEEPLALVPAIRYVEEQFRSKVSSGKAAALCGLSAFQFSRVFKDAYRMTFQEYLLRFRVREGCRLLKNPKAQVADVAHLVGFNDSSYFCRIFKRYTHTSPSRFATISEPVLDPERLLDVLEAN
jgi:YesN/AraC family two-component response regulator